MEQIRVSKGIEIGVNDNGDSIFIDANNSLFMERYYNLIDNIQKIADDIPTDIDDERKEVEIIVESMKKVCVELDLLFGVDACKKIFGEGFIPTPYAVNDFLFQLMPIIDKYADEREKKILAKYHKRTGGKRV